MLVVLPSWLSVGLPLAAGGGLAIVASRRFALLPGQIVAFGALAALLLLLGVGTSVEAADPAVLLGRPLAGVLVVGLFSLAAQRVLAEAPGGGAALGAQVVAVGAACGALLAP